MSLFTLKGVEKEFKQGHTNEKVINGINLELQNEEITALVGASGSGKSTLLTIAAGLQDVTRGDIIFNQKNISDMKDDEIRSIRAEKFGFVFQQAHLVPFLTVKEQLELMISVSGTVWSKEEKKRRIETLLKNIDMWHRKDSYPESLSGGEKQRTAIARAVIHEPEILFADEPTASLDSKRSEEVMKLIYDLSKDKKITVLMVTHDNDMLSYADRIVEMKDGIIQPSEK